MDNPIAGPTGAISQVETIISADQKTPGVLANLRTLCRHRELLFTLTARDIKVRYKQSVLGVAWAVMRPFLLMLVFTIVFSRLARIDTGQIPYPIFSYCALLPWTFFATSMNLGSQSLVSNMNLVTKIYFPREVLPLASIGGCSVDFLVGSILFIGMMFFYRIQLTSNVFWIPGLFVLQVIFVSGLSLFVSALNVFYRDIKHVTPVAIQLWMYATPIIYPVTLIPEKYRGIYMLNPMAGIIDSYRRVLITGEPPNLLYLGLAGGIALSVLLIGYGYFKRAETKFADII